AVVHELAHLVTHQMTYNPYNSIPVWLNEGISMHAEGKMDEVYETSLKRALLANELVSVKSLSSPFSTDADIAHLSYAQSQSLVEYLINEYGSQKMEELLAVFRRGCTYDEGFLGVYGFDTRALDDSWQDYIRQQYGVSAPREMSVIPLCLNSSLVIVAILVAAGVMRRKRQAV
ncbi:MAG: peptidase MA family metallohydrolase, partial [Dehalococcoidales bacterium]|nr:peptidase MA family metallohydrolase [Dehalococcoidales bacterium]